MIKYEIKPGVKADGIPTYRLYRDVCLVTPFGSVGGYTLIAENEDKSILERAIDHLNQPQSDEQSS